MPYTGYKPVDYSSIPVYPKMVKCWFKGSIPASAPLCEDDSGNVAFVSQEDKTRWLKRNYKRGAKQNY